MNRGLFALRTVISEISVMRFVTFILTGFFRRVKKHPVKTESILTKKTASPLNSFDKILFAVSFPFANEYCL